MKPKPSLSALAGLALLGSVAQADELVYAFTAELDPASLGEPVLAGSIAERLLDNNITTLTGTFAYDPDAGRFGVGSSRQEEYLTGQLLFDQFPDLPNPSPGLFVSNDIGFALQDEVMLTQLYPNDLIDFELVDSSEMVFSDVSLPSAINFDDFDENTIRFRYFQGEGDSGAFINPAVYTITSLTLVPEPTSLALLGLGGLLVTLRRRPPASPTDNRTTTA
ncbi:MAG: PEP-CTERM sorting domain-containing protein [Planctomycetota bacterium]